MIPKNLNPLEAQKFLIKNVQQSKTVEERGMLMKKSKENRFDDWKYRPVRGRCLNCERPNVLIVKKSHQLCKYCLEYAKRRIVSKHGFYHQKYIPEGLAEFWKPVKCRFHDICGGEVPRKNPDGSVKLKLVDVCDKCKPVFYAGHQAGSKQKRRTSFRRLNQPGYEL